MNVYKIMGLEHLLKKNEAKALERHIVKNARYIIPGYKYNYRLYTFHDYIEFHRCELLDGTHVYTNIHFSANHHWKLKADTVIKGDVTAPYYGFESKSGGIIPVRIICPDIFPTIEKGDVIDGQVVSFADSVEKLSDSALDGKVTGVDEAFCVINGRVVDVNRRCFEYEETKCPFFELDVETENGVICVLITENNIAFTPKRGDVITSHAVISMDVGIRGNQKIYTRRDDAFYRDPYKGLLEDTEISYKNGLSFNYSCNQKAFVDSIVTGDISRFARCCEKELFFYCTKDEPSSTLITKNQLISTLEAILPSEIERVNVEHLLSCSVKNIVGHDVISIYSKGKLALAIWFDICERGTIDNVVFISPEECTLGLDYELHLHTMLASALCNNRWYILSDILSDKCMYFSSYTDTNLVGASRIIYHLTDTDNERESTEVHTYDIALAADELCTTHDLPKIYQGKYCTVNYINGKPAYVTFLAVNDNHKICNVRMTYNGCYLKRFKTENTSKSENTPKLNNVSDIITSVYGKENTVASMRENEIPEVDPNCVYVWKKADEFATSWLRDNGYKTTEAVLTDDSIAYACERRGTLYAVFFYAYGERKTTMLDGKYCSRLRDEAISQGREIIIIYLRVIKKADSKGGAEYTVCSYGGEDNKIEPWLLTSVNSKDILRFYPRKEMMDLIPRLISAYNTRNFDALRVLCTSDAYLEDYDVDGRYYNSDFYSHLSYIREKYGKMKLAYVRFSDVVYCAVPYIEGYAYVSFSAGNKIESITMNPLDEHYRELLVLDGDVDFCPANTVPAISEMEFLKPSDIARFSLRLTFANGEVKRYDLAGDFDDSEIVSFQNVIMTDIIFANGHLTDSLPAPDIEYGKYSKRGQGIEFMSGATISAEELYHNSYPIEAFSYKGMDNVFIMQMDYEEDGFAVGNISNMDPTNPCYLFDRNTMTAKTIPEKYKNTPVGIYPFFGGYSEGLVMVSEFGELTLQYHHNRASCAGLWGWLDKNMKVVIEPKYVYALNFTDGRAIVCKGDWDVEIAEDGKKQYWCENEQWGVIDKNENEIVPCRFDELYEIDNTDRYYFVHEGGWKSGHSAIFDTEEKGIVLALDFDFDIGYMFNGCFVTDEGILVFDNHLPGDEKDLIYAYDLAKKQYIVHGECLEGRTLNGESRCVVNRDGEDIIVF